MNNPTRTILFCDCHHFSRVQLELGDRILEFMDVFYDRCGGCLVLRGGRIIKYLGDAILATFPEDQVARAVDAGQCLRTTYAEIVDEFDISVETDMEVGLSFGEVFEGTVGHESLRSFDVFGEVVNEAAMIGHHRGIAITDTVRERLPPDTQVRALEPFRPKWREQPLAVWEVVQPD